MRSKDTALQIGRQKAAVAKSPRPANRLLYCLFVLLLLTNAATGLALYFTPEIRSLFSDDNTEILAAYEQRITELRLEVDRLHSRQYARMGDMNLQMHELVQQQEVLAEQHEYVRALAGMAREMGIATAPVEPAETAHPPVGDTAELANALIGMQEETRMALAALSDAATLSTNEIVTELRTIGIQPDVDEVTGIGGPFIPADADTDISIVGEANAVANALSRYRLAREALLSAPVQTPVKGNIGISSTFGTRTDPFLKRPAFHAGIDFRARTGTPVLAAANGTVIHAGFNGGYGNLVEIDHGNGLITRYAHMNSIAVSKGQQVTGGETLGLSGSTGRSTGPHLHFEVRRDGNAINPARFLEAGRNLAKFI